MVNNGKHKHMAAFLAAIIFMSISGSNVSVFAASNTEKKIEEAKEAAKKMQAEIEEAQDSTDTIKEAKKNLDALADKFDKRLETASSELSDIGGQLQAKQAEINALTDDLEEAEKELDAIEKDLAATQEDLDVQYQALKTRIKYMYEKGTPSAIDIVFGTSSMGDYYKSKTYIDALTDYNIEALDKYKKAVNDVASKKKKADADKLAIEQEKETLEAEKAELEDLFQDQVLKREEIADLIETASSTIAMTDKQLEEAMAAADALQKQLDEQNANIENLQKQLEEEKRLQELSDAEKWRDMSDVVISANDEKLMANIIFCEAGNQPYEGQVAVGAVVMNRVKSSAFPDTISEVIYQKGQFEPVLTGRYAIALAKDEATESCYKAARAAMSGETTVDDCLFFRTPISGINYKYKIAGHIFY